MQIEPRQSRERRGEEGFGLLFGLFAMAIVGVIGWTMVTNGLVDMTISDNYRHKSTAFFAADSGLEQSVVDMKIDDDWIQQIIDPAAWGLMDTLPASITINGHTVTPTSDGAGGWVPGYYPYGDPVQVGEGTYQREIYLPPTVGTFNCEEGADGNSGSADSKSSKSKDSKSDKSDDSGSQDDDDDGSKDNDSGSKDKDSKSNKSNDSGSNASGSGNNGSGNDECVPSWGQDSGSQASGSGSSKSEDSKSNESDDSGSSGDGYADAGLVPSGFLASAAHGLAAALLPRGLLLAAPQDAGGNGQGQEKVGICHAAGPHDKILELTVGSPAYDAHLAHGDSLNTEGCTTPGETGANDGGGVITFSVRATGTAGQTETAIQVLRADIEVTVNPDGTVSDIRVINWLQER